MSPVKACHCLFAFAWLVGERLVGGLFSLSLDSEGVGCVVVVCGLGHKLLWLVGWVFGFGGCVRSTSSECRMDDRWRPCCCIGWYGLTLV